MTENIIAGGALYDGTAVFFAIGRKNRRQANRTMGWRAPGFRNVTWCRWRHNALGSLCVFSIIWFSTIGPPLPATIFISLAGLEKDEKNNPSVPQIQW